MLGEGNHENKLQMPLSPMSGNGAGSHGIDFVIMGKVVWSYEVKASWYLLAGV